MDEKGTLNNIKVSIIIPIYNKEKYLNTLWIDLLNQSFKEFECILIDDGSTDKSGKMCDEIAEKDKRFTVIHSVNNGVSIARNKGLDIAKGKYITFIDADDRLHEKYIENLYECIVIHKVDFVISGIEKKWDNSDYSERIELPYEGIRNKEEYMPEFVDKQLESGIYGFCVAKIIDKKIIGNQRFNPKIRLAEDLEFYLSIYEKINKIYFDDKYYYYYLQEAENSSMQSRDHEIDYFVQLKILYKMMNMLKNKRYFDGDNKTRIISRMSDYVFFTLFHAPRNKINDYCKMIRGLDIEIVILKEKSILQRIVLKLYKKNMDHQLFDFIRLYRFVKRKGY